jgi:hypothetical protein
MPVAPRRLTACATNELAREHPVVRVADDQLTRVATRRPQIPDPLGIVERLACDSRTPVRESDLPLPRCISLDVHSSHAISVVQPPVRGIREIYEVRSVQGRQESRFAGLPHPNGAAWADGRSTRGP